MLIGVHDRRHAFVPVPGYLVMLRPALATQPEALTAIVCGACCLLAPITLTPYKYAVFLTIITFNSLVLCQYRCAPHLPDLSYPLFASCPPSSTLLN